MPVPESQQPDPSTNAKSQQWYRHRPQVQQGDLEQGIRTPIAPGWEPETKGKPFHIDP